MAYSNQQYREILSHLERLLSDAGFGSVLDEAGTSAREDARLGEGLRVLTIAYIRAVISGLDQRSRRTYERARHLAGDFIQTETGELISDISIVTTPEDRELLGFEELSLSTAPDVQRLIQDLEEVISDLQRE